MMRYAYAFGVAHGVAYGIGFIAVALALRDWGICAKTLGVALYVALEFAVLHPMARRRFGA